MEPVAGVIIHPVARRQINTAIIDSELRRGHRQQVAANHFLVRNDPNIRIVLIIVNQRRKHRLSEEPRAVSQRVVVRSELVALAKIEKIALQIPNPVRWRVEFLAAVIGVRPDRNIKERGVGEPLRIDLVDRAFESLAMKSADIRSEIIDSRH